MRVKLTKTVVSRLAPLARPYHVFDSELRGLVLRVQPTGQATYYFDYRRADGRRTRFKLGASPNVSPDGARALARQESGRVAGGVDISAERKKQKTEAARAKVSTLGVFLDGKYVAWARSNLRSGEIQVDRLKADFADWLAKPMASISPWLIETYRKKRKDKGRSPKTINREVQRLRSAVAKAVAWGLLESHPFAAVKPLKTDKVGRVRYLSIEEEQRLRAALEQREANLRAARDRFNDWRKARGYKLLPPRTSTYIDHLRPMVLVAMNTGLRRGEQLSLKWGDVNLDDKMLTVRGHTAKTGQTRRVPLNSEATEALAIWREQSEEDSGSAQVFPANSGGRMQNINRSWDTVSTLAQLSDFRFHDLRHHFASKLVMAGVPLNTVRELLGHTTLEMTQRYSHLSPDVLASAVEKLRA